MNYFNLIIIVVMLLCITTTSAQEYKIVEAESGKAIEVSSLIKELMHYDVVFFGELHDDSLLHFLEADLFQKLVEEDPNFVLSMEMFERDNQIVLDKYIDNEIDYNEFTQKARLWPNHHTDYEPLLQIAKKYNRKVIAANVPRKYAGLLAKNGEKGLEGITDLEKAYLAQNLVVLDDRYKKEFYATMQGMFDHGMPNSNAIDQILNIYKAQCLKDDTMAESINNYLKENDGHKVLHINGDFHSRYFLGTAQKLALLNENLKIAVISPVTYTSDEKLMWKAEHSDAGDYLLLIHRDETR